jgi:serine/threonine protein kinase
VPPFSDTLLARFEREAKTLATLNHPNVAHIYGLEQSEGRSALVLEFVDGEDLASRIANGAFPFEDAVSIARQIVDALDAAHEHGIVHRDLKPANIMITPDGTVKVLDFGLAKAFDTPWGRSSDLSKSPTMTSPAVTAEGIILGTAAYMSPEQARGKAVDKRTDIWAFGCVLFEMLALKPAFDIRETVPDAVAAVLRTEPQWDSLPTDTPPKVRALLVHCLQKDPKQRLRDIADGHLLHAVCDRAALAARLDRRLHAASRRGLRTQVVRQLTAADEGLLDGHRVLICDRDRKWSLAVRELLEASGVRVIQTPFRAAIQAFLFDGPNKTLRMGIAVRDSVG